MDQDSRQYDSKNLVEELVGINESQQKLKLLGTLNPNHRHNSYIAVMYSGWIS